MASARFSPVVPNIPARHFNNFSFLPLDPVLRENLQRSAHKLILKSGQYADRGGTSNFPLIQGRIDGRSNTAETMATRITVRQDAIRVLVQQGDVFSRYRSPRVFKRRDVAPIPEGMRGPINDFVTAVTDFNTAVVTQQRKSPSHDPNRPGAPVIESPKNLVKVLMTFKTHALDQSFHNDGIGVMNDGIGDIYVSDSPQPTMFAERAVPVLRGNEAPIRRLDIGESEDGRNIPFGEVHSPADGQVALWDSKDTTHSNPAVEGYRPFTRFEYRNHERV